MNFDHQVSPEKRSDSSRLRLHAGRSDLKLLISSLLSVLLFGFALLPSCRDVSAPDADLVQRLQRDTLFDYVEEKARAVVRSGFNAGDGYGEVWIRDFNTFIELSCEVSDQGTIRDHLLVFLRMQGGDGNIMDGFIPREKAQAQEGGYDYRYSELEPRYAGHKNTVETDQETSLVQAVYKYVQATGDRSIMTARVGEASVADRLEQALQFLFEHRFSEDYGLIWGATTADWGDVQPEHEWGVYLTDDTHYCLDIYDNAMLVIALDNFLELLPERAGKWRPINNALKANIRQHLWDANRQKFIPHVYLEDSPFSDTLNEAEIYYHGGTAVAIEAGLLSREEVFVSLKKMIANVEAAGAPSIGLTLYPPYPAGSFKNPGMYPYGYQNGGDWTWFGGRMIRQLIHYGFVEEAYEQVQPMLERVKANDGFYEWYSLDNQPKGSGTFRGSAGVLYSAIQDFRDWGR